MISQSEKPLQFSLHTIRNDVNIYIQQIDRSIPTGLICHSCLEEPVPFYGLGEMIMKIDALYDEIGFPKADPKRRPLRARARKRKAPVFSFRRTGFNRLQENFCTFVIQLRYRQHVSWQGSVRFIRDTREYPFRSVLELIGYLMEKLEEMEKRG